MCNLYSITTNQEAIRALFRVMNRYVGNLAPMPGVFPDYPAPVVRTAGAEREMIMMRWGMPPPRVGGFPVTNIRNTTSIRYVMKNGELFEGDTLDRVWPRPRSWTPRSTRHRFLARAGSAPAPRRRTMGAPAPVPARTDPSS